MRRMSIMLVLQIKNRELKSLHTKLPALTSVIIEKLEFLELG